MPNEVKFEDNSNKIISELKGDALIRALTRIGMQAEGYAKDSVLVNTGLLRNSITFALSGEAPNTTSYKSDNGSKSGSYSGVADKDENMSVYIGTNVGYAITVETGAKPSNDNIVESGSSNDPPNPNPGKIPTPFLKPAIVYHIQTYKNIVEDELKKPITN